MNIHIRIEVLAREFTGRLLLGLVAADRGHTVLLHDKRTAYRILDDAARPSLPPAIYHDNTPGGSMFGKTLLHRRLVARGFRVTGQDEEHGLSTDDFDADMGGRFPADAVENLAAVLAFGPFDAAGIRRAVPDHASKVVETGSPRVDLWRPDLAGAFPRPPALRPSDRPFVLWAMTQSPFYGPGPEPIDVADRSLSAEELLTRIEELPSQGSGLGRVELDHFRMAVHTRTAVDAVADAFPDLDIVYRPHPVERREEWDRIFAGGPPNVHVILDNAVSPWIRHAACTVTTGSTIAFEAAIAKRPLIAFHPERMVSWPAVSRLGSMVDSVPELLERIAGSIGRAPGLSADGTRGAATEALLSERFTALEGRLAADRIVDAWESVATDAIECAAPVDPDLLASGGPWPGPVVRGRRALLARLRRGHDAAEGEGSLDPRRKFPDLDLEEIRRFHADLRAALDRFHDVELDLLGPRLLRVAPRDRGTA